MVLGSTTAWNYNCLIMDEVSNFVLPGAYGFDPDDTFSVKETRN